MAWDSHMRSGFDLNHGCCKGGGSSMGAWRMFDEMPTSELEYWREPSRVLEVTIRHAYYPITKMVLHQVFDTFGAVEINVCELFERVEARILLPSTVEAAEAFGEFHGRNIYDGCCQLDIKWGISQEIEIIPDMGCRNTTNELCATVTSHGDTTACLCQEFSSPTTAKEPILDPVLTVDAFLGIDAEPSNINIDTPLNCLVKCLSHVVKGPAFGEESDEGPVFDEEPIIDKDPVFDKEPIFDEETGTPTMCSTIGLTVDTSSVQATAMFLLVVGVFTTVPTPGEAADVSPLKLPVDIGLNTPLPARCLLQCLRQTTGAAVPAYFHDAIPVAPLAPTLLGLDTQSLKCNVNVSEFRNVSASVPTSPTTSTVLGITNYFGEYMLFVDSVILWHVPRKRIEWKPWPPPTQLQCKQNGAVQRPQPWPSF